MGSLTGCEFSSMKKLLPSLYSSSLRAERAGHGFAIPIKCRQFQYLLVVYISVFERLFGVPACGYKTVFSRLATHSFLWFIWEKEGPWAWCGGYLQFHRPISWGQEVICVFCI